MERNEAQRQREHSQFLTEQEFKKPYAPFLIESVLGDSKNTEILSHKQHFSIFKLVVRKCECSQAKGCTCPVVGQGESMKFTNEQT